MKKILFFVVFIALNLNISYANNNFYSKIDSIYENKPEDLITIKDKIDTLLEKKYNTQTRNILAWIKKYIDYKLKNDDYYNQEISIKTKKLVNNSYLKSFTDQETLEKLQNIDTINLALIDKEYINFHILETQVSILLNHQNFTEAEKITKDYFTLKEWYDENKLFFITKNVSYSSFWVLIQLVSWIKPEKKSDIITLRNKYYPKEANSAYNIVRKYWYENQDCDELDIVDKNLDIIDRNTCKLLNWGMSIEDLDEINDLNNNLQNLSDKINYYSNIWRYYSEYQEEMVTKIKSLGEIIIEKDKNFINGYLWLLLYFDSKNDCANFDKYSLLMFENYIWDNQRKEFLSDLVETNYLNCSTITTN